MATSDFEQFVTSRSLALLRAGWLPTGDEQLAHDLVQTALLRTWQRWDRLRETGAAEAYVRRTMITSLITWRRRRSFGERPVADVPDVPATEIDPDARGVVAAALQALPPRQRAVIVLRYFLDLSEADTAAAMG